MSQKLRLEVRTRKLETSHTARMVVLEKRFKELGSFIVYICLNPLSLVDFKIQVIMINSKARNIKSLFVGKIHIQTFV